MVIGEDGYLIAPVVLIVWYCTSLWPGSAAREKRRIAEMYEKIDRMLPRQAEKFQLYMQLGQFDQAANVLWTSKRFGKVAATDFVRRLRGYPKISFIAG